MSAAAKQIIEAALKLDPTERAHVAHELLESITGDANGGLDAEWVKELEQRARDIEEGRTDFLSWSDARREIESGLRRSR
jgi:putative addiction module component (TIGR02574 family)